MSLFSGYVPGEFFDEVFAAPGVARPHYGALLESVGKLSPAEYGARQRAVDAAFLRQGTP